MNDLLFAFLRGPWRHARNLVRNKEYRTLAMLMSRYRFVGSRQPRTITFGGSTFEVPDVPSFLSTYYSVFVRRVYAFPSPRPDPFIVDCGANVGLSVLYFKTLYPNAQVVAYEADPAICGALDSNVRANNLIDVRVVNAAVGVEDKKVEFRQDGTDSGRVISPRERSGHVVEVNGVRLRDQIAGRSVDFLKMDIEGAETEVLLDCADCLSEVHALCLEFHTFPDEPQRLGEVLIVLEKAGFRVSIESVHERSVPLSESHTQLVSGMDLQLHICAYRC